MNNDTNRQVKRYTDIETQKCAKTCCRVSVILASVVVGSLAIFFGVFFTKKAPNAPTH